jgi:hypothetical protein
VSLVIWSMLTVYSKVLDSTGGCNSVKKLDCPDLEKENINYAVSCLCFIVCKSANFTLLIETDKNVQYGFQKTQNLC